MTTRQRVYIKQFWHIDLWHRNTYQCDQESVATMIFAYAVSIWLTYWQRYQYQGRIQDLWLGGGAWVGEGSGDRLRSPAGPRQSPGRGPGGRSTPEALGFEELQTFIWTTILNQPHHFYQTKTTWLWVLILSDNC